MQYVYIYTVHIILIPMTDILPVTRFTQHITPTQEKDTAARIHTHTHGRIIAAPRSFKYNQEKGETYIYTYIGKEREETIRRCLRNLRCNAGFFDGPRCVPPPTPPLSLSRPPPPPPPPLHFPESLIVYSSSCIFVLHQGESV